MANPMSGSSGSTLPRRRGRNARPNATWARLPLRRPRELVAGVVGPFEKKPSAASSRLLAAACRCVASIPIRVRQFAPLAAPSPERCAADRRVCRDHAYARRALGSASSVFQDDHDACYASNPTAPAGTVANPHQPAGVVLSFEPWAARLKWLQCISLGSAGRRLLAAASARNSPLASGPAPGD
jgi:hypothetical protein